MKLKDFIEKIFKKKKEDIENIGDIKGAVSSDTFVKTELTNDDIAATKAAHDEIIIRKNKRKKLIKRIAIIMITNLIEEIKLNIIILILNTIIKQKLYFTQIAMRKRKK